MEFQCPFTYYQYHVPPFTNPWDYFCHLQKCHIINQEIQKEKKNSFFICQFCLSIFESICERDQHALDCNKANFKSLFRDIQLPVQLGKQGKYQIAEIIHFYKEMIQNPSVGQMTEEIQPQPLPKAADPRLQAAVGPSVQVSTNQKKLILDVLPIGQNITAACCKFFRNYSLESINRKFDYKVGIKSLLSFLRDRAVELNEEIYRKSLVCEFMEDKWIDKQFLSEAYIKINTVNQQTTIWVLLHEQATLFPAIEYHQPWHIVALTTSVPIEDCRLELKTDEQTELEAIKREIVESEKRNKDLEQKLLQLHNEQQDYFKQVEIKMKRVEKLDVECTELQTRLIKYKRESESIQQQSEMLARQKLKKAKEDLEEYYRNQVNREKQTKDKGERRVELEKCEEKKLRLEQQVNELLLRKEELEKQIELANQEIHDNEVQYGKQMQLKRQSDHLLQSRNQQLIDQSICIECKRNARSVIQYPCHHILFCEHCFLGKLNQRYFKCPLSTIGQCKDNVLEKKYKVIAL